MKKLLLATAFILILSPLTAIAHTTTGKVTIHMDEKGFDPKNVTITVGQTVVFENRGKEKHWPASNIHPTHEIYAEFDSMKGVEAGKSWEFTFTKAGIWKMHDHLFAEFGGTITVTKDIDTKTVTATAEKKSFWQKIASFFSSLFVSKKDAKEPIASSKPSTNPSDAVVTPELKKKAEALKDIAKESREIWTNEAALFAYMQKYGARQTFATLDAQEKQGVGDCHQTAHTAGHFGLALFGNEILKDCDLTCHSGCYHGATEAYFKVNGSEDLAQGLNSLCSSVTGNSFYSHQCYHGLGHGLMAWTNYDLPEALKTCDLLNSSQGSCWTGVFMENIVAGLATDTGDVHISAYKNDDPLYPCTIVEEKYKTSCYFLQTSRMMQMYGVDFKKMADACSLAPKEYRFSCFQSMGRDVSSAYRPTPERSILECGHAPKEYRIDCLNGAVQDALWDISGQDTAITFCKLLTDKAEKDACYNTIIPRMREVAQNDAQKQIFCGKVETSHRPICF